MDPYALCFASPWRPNYVDVWQWRQQKLFELRNDHRLLHGAKVYYKQRPAEFITHWMDTYDPRNAGSNVPTNMPFVLFPRQVDMIEFLYGCLIQQTNGLIEKSRDMGATWVSCAVSVHLWLFWEGSSVGWGSRKSDLVDKLGDPDSIFEKIRKIVDALPPEFLPTGFISKEHSTYMRLVNPDNGATVTGEAGDNIGRGGRKTIYFKDESAHYERPEKIEAALGDNTRVQIDISSVSGVGNVFHRKREAGVEWISGLPEKGATNVFVMDWSDHPLKDQAWYDQRKKEAKDAGLYHLFAQEVDRDYSAAISNIIIKREWVMAAVDAHKVLGWDGSGQYVAGLDLAEEGEGDKNALVVRKGPMIFFAEEWPGDDVGKTTRETIAMLEHLENKVEVDFDVISIGSGVKSEANRLYSSGEMPNHIEFVPWTASASPRNPDQKIDPFNEKSPTNKEFFHNLKAQGWWELRKRFYNTWRAIHEGIEFDADELIFISSEIPQLQTLIKQISQPTVAKTASALKLVVDKTPEGTVSPNMGDGTMMCCWPQSSGYTLDNL